MCLCEFWGVWLENRLSTSRPLRDAPCSRACPIAPARRRLTPELTKHLNILSFVLSVQTDTRYHLGFAVLIQKADFTPRSGNEKMQGREYLVRKISFLSTLTTSIMKLQGNPGRTHLWDKAGFGSPSTGA